jgi:hypothetical protein
MCILQCTSFNGIDMLYYFMIATRCIYFCYTQLVSTTGPIHRVSEDCMRSMIDSSGPRLRALSDNHVTDAVPKTWLGDGAREQGRFEERDV